jgi:hydroxypyruvate isomerase
MRIWASCREGLTEAAKFAADHGITLALQNHPPVIGGYRDVLRMVSEVGAQNLKVCFDTRLEHEMSPTMYCPLRKKLARYMYSPTTATSTRRQTNWPCRKSMGVA